MNTTFSLIGLAAIFAMAYGLDRWAELLLLRQARHNFYYTPYFWFLSMTNLILASSMLMLAWFVWFRTNKSRLISVVFVIIGLLVTFASAIVFSVLLTPLPLGVWEFLHPTSRAVFVSTFVTATGIAGLIVSKR